MAQNSRIDEFRRRRYRATVRRRGTVQRTPPPACRDFRGFLRCAGKRLNDREQEYLPALWTIARRIHRYPGVAGLLHRRIAETVEVLLVAPRPMTALMRILASAWNEELRTQHPALDWDLKVRSTSPKEGEKYRCLYWRSV